jgi:tetratricopeptide (TPR) repeat protein
LYRTSGNVVELSLAHNALGVSQYYGCCFDKAEKSLQTAFKLAQSMGDDSRVSLTASNLGVLRLISGDLNECVRWCRLALDVGERAIRQPTLAYAHTNLAQALALAGDAPAAREHLEAARNLNARSWRVDVVCLSESANVALMEGNVSLALQQIESLETMASGRELAMPEQAVFRKLQIFRAAYTNGDDAAWALAREQIDRFPDHHTTYFLEVLAAVAWLERRTSGKYSSTTAADLGLFEEVGALGLKSMLTLEGFLA